MDVVNKNQCSKLIRDFIDEKLQGDIEKIKDFNFNELKEDKKYGCPDHNKEFDADDTILARAIYCVVWSDDLPDINFNNIGSGKDYRGDIINSFNTLFSSSLNEKLSNIRGNNYKELKIGNKGFLVEDKKLIQSIIEFHKLYRTIGNMAVLPNISHNSNNINQYRGMKWKDYYDKFLLELRLSFLSDYSSNDGFKELLKANSFYFDRFEKSERGFKEFCRLNFIDYYIDNEISFGVSNDNGVVYPSWQMSRFWRENQNYYNKFAEKYIEKSSEVIRYRGNIILEQLRKKISL